MTSQWSELERQMDRERSEQNEMIERVSDIGTESAEILREVKAIRASQERTEALVMKFIEDMSRNPMFRTMAGAFGVKR